MSASTKFSFLTKKENAHSSAIYCCATARINTSGDASNVSKDFVVTGGLDCLVKIWILENDNVKLLFSLEGHPTAVGCVAISPTAPILISSSLDSSIIFWELLTGKKLGEIPILVSDVWKMTFSKDGKHFATGGHTGKIHVYEVQSRKIVKILHTRGRFILSIAYSPNGKFIATGSEDGVLCLMNVAQDLVVHSVKEHADSIRSVAFSPCNRRLATASNDGFVKIFDAASVYPEHSLDHKTWAVGVCYTSDGTRVVTASADGSVRVALSDGLTVLHKFKEHTDVIWGVHFNASNNRIISTAKDGCINIYECPAPPKIAKKKVTLVKATK